MVQKRNSNKNADAQKKDIVLEIILVLISEKTHIREIARKIRESPTTVLRRINELFRENIVDYILAGRNKVYFIKNSLKSRNYLYSAELYKLSKFLNQHPEIGIIIEDLKKNVAKGMIILFGSYAKGIAKSDSDIDIYVETENLKLKKNLEEINSKLSIKIGKFDINSNLIKEMIKNHIIIKGVEEYYEKTRFFEEN